MEHNLRQWVYARAVAVMLAVMLVGGSFSPAQADFLSDAGMGVATVAATMVYTPAKLIYATVGGITGGFTYVLTGGNYETAAKVWNPALGGNYLLNPNHLRGQETIYFSGPTP